MEQDGFRHSMTVFEITRIDKIRKRIVRQKRRWLTCLFLGAKDSGIRQGGTVIALESVAWDGIRGKTHGH